MKVKQIMTSPAETVETDTTIIEAAQKMRLYNIGSLPVCQDNTIIGMLTDRDIAVRAVAQGKDISETTADEIMTPMVFYCFEDDDVQRAAMIMEEQAVRRLVVLTGESLPAGIVSLADISVKVPDEHLCWEVLERVSEPACPNK